MLTWLTLQSLSVMQTSLLQTIIETLGRDDLLMEKLSNVLSEDQKRTKIRNLLYDMSKKENLIENSSKSTASPIWILQAKTD